MTEIEKAVFATELVNDLLKLNKKILAVKLLRLFYKTGLKQAKDFADQIEAIRADSKETKQ